MKKIFCICLVVLLCFGIFGCQKEEGIDPSETLPVLSENKFETLPLDQSDYIYGEIIGKMSPNVLVLKPDSERMIEVWGETVYVITDDADQWCVEDEISVTFSLVERPTTNSDEYVRIIADHVYPLAVMDKPIIYFYPETPTPLSVKLTLNGSLTCTYPDYGIDGWQNFTAYPDGTLIFPDGKEYYALYWEGVQGTDWDFSRGWCVRGEDTAEFLEWALAEQGLTPREANEFIVYWLPIMHENLYNVISFQTNAYTDGAVLHISPAPDSLLRVFMAYYPTDEAIDIEPQIFEVFTRRGFTVVEWGGSQVKKP